MPSIAAIVAKLPSSSILHVSPGRSGHMGRNFSPRCARRSKRLGIDVLRQPKIRPSRKLGIDVPQGDGPQITSPVKSVLPALPRRTHRRRISLSTPRHAHEGRASWLKQSVDRPIARAASGQMTLFHTGSRPGLRFRRGWFGFPGATFSIPSRPRASAIGGGGGSRGWPRDCNARVALSRCCTSATRAPCQWCRAPKFPAGNGKKSRAPADVIHGIVDTASKEAADLIVMSTDGRDGFSGCPARQPQRTGVTKRAPSA
jgi:hypothetical protein